MSCINKFVFIIIALLVISGAAYADTLTVSEKSWKKDAAGPDGYDVVIPQITNMHGDAINQLNKKFINMAQNAISDWKNCTIDLKEEREKYGLAPCYESISYTIYDKNVFNIVSIKFDTYHFTGGAHGLPGTTVFNINQQTGKELIFDDIFVSGARKYFETEISKQMAQDKETYFSDTSPDLRKTSFYFEGNDVVFVFPPYAIAPYSSGMPEFRFNKNNIKKWLKKL
jgi:hypothetical protein